MGWFDHSSTRAKKISWEPLETVGQLEKALSVENERPLVIFKHSTRCSISSMALSRFENEWNEELDCSLLFLDLLQHRELSARIAERTGVKHESPQAILLVKGNVLYHASHNGIQADAIEKIIKGLQA